jgi:hypothetical protein
MEEAAVHCAGHAVADFPGPGRFAAGLDSLAGIIAPTDGVWWGEVVGVRVQRHGVNFDKDFVIGYVRDANVLEVQR